MYSQIFKGRQWSTLLLACLAAVLCFLTPIFAARADAVEDTRIEADLYAHLDEPGWAFANTDVQIVGNFILDDWTGVLPEGIVRATPLEPGAKSTDYRIYDGATDFQPYITTSKKVGTAYYKIEYLGDANYKPISRVFAYTVLAGPYTKTTLKSVPTGSVTAGRGLTLMASVSATNGSIAGRTNGTITFYDGSLELGSAWFDTFDQPGGFITIVPTIPGTHKYTAIFEPGSPLPYQGSKSNTVSINVLR